MTDTDRPSLGGIDSGLAPIKAQSGRLTRLAEMATRRPALTVSALMPILVVFYAALLTRGSFDFSHSTAARLAFNSMLLHLLNGQFDVDPDTIGSEGFSVNGRIYSYFGIFPALFRLLFWPFVDMRTTNLTIQSCVVATLILAGAQAMLTLRLFGRYGVAGRLKLFTAFFAIALVAGPQIMFLRASIYQEVVQWSLAFAMLFIWGLLEILMLGRRPGFAMLTALAVLAGLTLLTRVSTAVGLYGAVATLLLALPALAPSGTSARAGVRNWLTRIAGPLAILLLFAAVALIVNQMRFGNPLKFIDLRYQLVSILENPDRIARIEQYGEFNLARIWYGLLYYFVPIWMIRGPDGLIAFPDFRHRMFDMVELPPSTFFLSDPLLLAFAAMGLVLTIRTFDRDRTRAAILLGAAGSMAAPCLLVLGAISLAFRYRGDFYPLFLLLAFIGLGRVLDAPAGRFRTLQRAAPRLALVSVLSASILFGLYNLSPFGDSERELKSGWVELYGSRMTPHPPASGQPR